MCLDKFLIVCKVINLGGKMVLTTVPEEKKTTKTVEIEVSVGGKQKPIEVPVGKSAVTSYGIKDAYEKATREMKISDDYKYTILRACQKVVSDKELVNLPKSSFGKDMHVTNMSVKGNNSSGYDISFKVENDKGASLEVKIDEFKIK